MRLLNLKMKNSTILQPTILITFRSLQLVKFSRRGVETGTCLRQREERSGIAPAITIRTSYHFVRTTVFVINAGRKRQDRIPVRAAITHQLIVLQFISHTQIAYRQKQVQHDREPNLALCHSLTACACGLKQPVLA